jgi:hypothetical protein
MRHLRHLVRCRRRRLEHHFRRHRWLTDSPSPTPRLHRLATTLNRPRHSARFLYDPSWKEAAHENAQAFHDKRGKRLNTQI